MPVKRSYVTDLYCPVCAKRYSIDTVINVCQCGKPLLVEYDYASIKTAFTIQDVTGRRQSMWRYREVLPVIDDMNIVTLDEGMTPLLVSNGIGPKNNHAGVYLKDESVNPTGSFKARGLGMAISRAKELGIEKIILPTAGNAGSAAAAYCARGGLRCKVIMPESTPSPFKKDTLYFGAEIEEVAGSIKDAGERAGELVNNEGWFSVATLKEPYRIEGKKTMGYELAEQLGFTLPDVIIYPTGGGTGLIGMWKAFDEMERLGWIGSKRPKMVSVQATGCAPIVQAFESHAYSAELWENPTTLASGLRVPSAIGDFLILDAIYTSNGCALAVSEEDILKGTKMLGTLEGIFAAPEGGATVAAYEHLVTSGYIKTSETVVLFITGSGYKYLDNL